MYILSLTGYGVGREDGEVRKENDGGAFMEVPASSFGLGRSAGFRALAFEAHEDRKACERRRAERRRQFSCTLQLAAHPPSSQDSLGARILRSIDEGAGRLARKRTRRCSSIHLGILFLTPPSLSSQQDAASLPLEAVGREK